MSKIKWTLYEGNRHSITGTVYLPTELMVFPGDTLIYDDVEYQVDRRVFREDRPPRLIVTRRRPEW